MVEVARKWKLAKRLRKKKNVRRMMEERVGLMELDGIIYISLDGLPLVKARQDSIETVKMLEGIRENISSYMLRV